MSACVVRVRECVLLERERECVCVCVVRVRECVLLERSKRASVME